tara:strand:- start:144 stop:377 length:234 start_codon:yes stop_codon:yes gene_type:complete
MNRERFYVMSCGGGQFHYVIDAKGEFWNKRFVRYHSAVMHANAQNYEYPAPKAPRGKPPEQYAQLTIQGWLNREVTK